MVPPDNGEGFLKSIVSAFELNNFLLKKSYTRIGQRGSARRALVREPEKPVSRYAT